MTADSYGRVVGIIRWFRSDLKYGFIKDENGDDGPRDVFFHICEFKPNVTPQPGQKVQYRIIYTDRGPKAIDCVLLPTEESEIDLSAGNSSYENIEHSNRPNGSNSSNGSNGSGNGQFDQNSV